MFHEFTNPIPVVTPLGAGYALYVRDGGTWENDVWCVVLADGGRVLHFRSDQISVWKNATFDIKPDGKENPDAEVKEKDLEQSLEKINKRYWQALRKLAESEKNERESN